MRRFVLVILALAMLLPSLAQAYDVLVLQGSRDSAYEEVVNGFREARSLSYRNITLSDYVEVDVERIVREERPALVVAVGDKAVAASRKVRQVPVIAVMAFGVPAGLSPAANLTGITMIAHPERYLAFFQIIKARRIGLIYDPAKTGWYLRQARLLAEKFGVELVAREVHSSRDVLSQLASLSGKIDALWMLPDSTAVSRETTEAYFRFGQQHTIPIVAFAGTYLRFGAAAVLEIERTDLGRQAAELASALLSPGRGASIPVAYPRNVVVKTNPTVMKRVAPIVESLRKMPPVQ